MWYIGTKKKCEAYNEKVSGELGFNGSITSHWADVRKHPSKSLFAIIAHPAIEADGLTPYEELPESWNPQEEVL